MLKKLGLTKAQKDILRQAFETMITSASRRANKDLGVHQRYFEGRADGLNSAFRFISGTLAEHDEWD